MAVHMGFRASFALFLGKLLFSGCLNQTQTCRLKVEQKDFVVHVLFAFSSPSETETEGVTRFSKPLKNHAMHTDGFDLCDSHRPLPQSSLIAIFIFCSGP